MISLEAPRGLSDWWKLYRLYISAFPPAERKPFSIIWKMYREGRSQVLCLRQDGMFAGLMTTILRPVKELRPTCLCQMGGMGAGGYGKQIKNARTQLDWLSTNKDVVDAYIADERCGFMFTVGGYSTLLDLTAEVVTSECASRVPKDLPVLFIAGDGDPVGNMGKGVQAAAQLLRDAGVKMVDCKLFEGMRHEIHNEIGYEMVYNQISSWVDAALQRGK
jgi:alpha-beta hydrolase superfamily lysophospholipase